LASDVAKPSHTRQHGSTWRPAQKVRIFGLGGIFLEVLFPCFFAEVGEGIP
jgi:hypothetical protein